MRSAFAIVLLLVAPVVLASDKLHTGSRPNGEYWRTLSVGERTQLITGMFIGLEMGLSYGDLSLEKLRALRPKTTFTDIVASVTSFYEEPLNRPIPIESAWLVITARDAGVSGEAMTKIVNDLRAASTGKLPANTPPPPTKHPEVYDLAIEHATGSSVFRQVFGTAAEFDEKRANAWVLSRDEVRRTCG